MRRALIAAALVVAGCSSSPPLADLLLEPQRYDGAAVTVSGAVGNPMAVLGIGGFFLNDGEASILVLTDSGVPAVGDHVTVSGKFIQAFSIAGASQSVVVQAETAVLRRLLSFKERSAQ